MKHPKVRLDNRSLYTIWAMSALAFWIIIARDQLGIAFCAIATVPVTQMFWREHKGLDETPAAQMIGTTFGFLSLLELGMFLFSFGSVQFGLIDHVAVDWTLSSSSFLAVVYGLGWFSLSAYAQGHKTLGFVRSITSAFIVIWILLMTSFYISEVHDGITFYQFIWLTTLPSIGLIAALFLGKRWLIELEGTAV
jgi:hypothetical protein